MAKIHEMKDKHKKRSLKLDHCAGCKRSIKEGDLYTEIVIPDSFNDDVVTHIALCGPCYEVARVEAGI